MGTDGLLVTPWAVLEKFLLCSKVLVQSCASPFLGGENLKLNKRAVLFFIFRQIQENMFWDQIQVVLCVVVLISEF